MRIDVWSDVVCPWCYLGKRRLDEALAGLDDVDDIEVRWRAFQLDPNASSEPGPLRPVIDAKYGPGAFESMSARLSALGEDAGIDYRWDEIQRVSSRAALDLVAWAEASEGAETAERLHDRLFLAYFSEGANISDPEALVGWAVDVVVTCSGCDGLGVPAFVFEDTWMVSGAQDVETLQAVITQVREKLAADA